MSRTKQVIRNMIIICIFLFLFLKLTGLSLTSLSAYKQSERKNHYGPSEIIHKKKINNNKYILGKYDKWVSCNTVTRHLFFFWHGTNPIGFENTKSKPIEYTWNISNKNLKIYGIINDERIKKIDVILENGKTTTITEFYENLFLYVTDTSQVGHTIMAYNINNELIYEVVY